MESSSEAERAFLQLPFDLYQRYSVARAVASLVRGRLGRPMRVLDVGGAAFTGDGRRQVLPIRLCLPDDWCVTLDSQECEIEGYVRGVGECLPFPDEGFDVVVSCDTLEHVQPDRREAFVEELLRVTSDFVILIAPCASHVTALAERILEQYITHSLGVTHRQLDEHLTLGLPERAAVSEFLARRHLSSVDFESGYIYSWLTVMLARHYLLSVPNSSQMITMFDEFYNVALSDLDHRRPGYRHVYVISKLRNEDVLRGVRSRFVPEKTEMYGTGAEVFQLAMTLLNLRRTEGADEEIWKKVAQKEAHIAHLETLVVERDRAIAELRAALREHSEHLKAYSDELEKVRSALSKSISWRASAAVSKGLVKARECLRSRRSG